MIIIAFCLSVTSGECQHVGRIHFAATVVNVNVELTTIIPAGICYYNDYDVKKIH